MRYASLVNGEVEIGKEEIKIGLCCYYDILEWSSMGNQIENGFIMVKDGIILVDNENVDLVIEFDRFNELKVEGDI